ncbi:MAG: 30S ribosomal protein S8 [Bacteroidota bacterium]
MDPIADYLTYIRNAVQAFHTTLTVKSSRIKKEITKLLKERGYITDYTFESNPPQGFINIKLRYNPQNKRPAITCIKRISKPSLRQYIKAKDLPHVLNGLGDAFISTSQGIMSDKEARKKNLGGEVLFHVY